MTNLSKGLLAEPARIHGRFVSTQLPRIERMRLLSARLKGPSNDKRSQTSKYLRDHPRSFGSLGFLRASSRVRRGWDARSGRPSTRGVGLFSGWWEASVALVFVLGASATVRAEDADRFRTYFHWRSYEADTIWGVDDANGISLGANFDRNWGGELALDALQLGLENSRGQLMAEQTSISLLPQVRLRQPFLDDRLVPYVLAGAGAAFLQFNDRKSHAFGLEIDAEGWKFAATAGVGIEYFLDDEIAFGFEGKYLWVDELDTRVGTETGTLDMSSFLLSFGLRMYFDENTPRALADLEGSPSASRFYFSMKAGGRVILDGDWGDGVTLTPLAQSDSFGVNKHCGLTFGANLNRNWAVEVALDGGETSIQIDDRHRVGEYSQTGIMPQIRYRWPVASGRWVPYALAGGGMLYAEFNDAKPQSVFYPGLDTKGFYPVIRFGGGVEYFITRSFSFGAEANYQYTWDHTINLPDRPGVTGDFSMFQALLMFRVYLFNL